MEDVNKGSKFEDGDKAIKRETHIKRKTQWELLVGQLD